MSHSIIIIEGKRILGKLYVEAKEDNVNTEHASGFFDVEEYQLEGIETLIERGRTLGSNLTITEYRAIVRLYDKSCLKTLPNNMDFSNECFYIALHVSNTID